MPQAISSEPVDRIVPDAGARSGAIGDDRLGRRHCGPGLGHRPAHGGMRIYASMRAREPDLFIHSGDLIYADPPIRRRGHARRRLVVEEPRHEEVAKVGRDAARVSRPATTTTCSTSTCAPSTPSVPMVAQWDDHEVLNNWYPGELLGDAGAGRRIHGEGRRHPRRASPARRFSTTRRCGRIGATRVASTASCATARCSRSSCSIAAPTAAPTPRTARRRPAPTRRCSARRSSPG